MSEERVADAKALVEALMARDYQRAFETFDGNMRAAMPPEVLSRVWEDLEHQCGPLRELLKHRSKQREARTVVMLLARFEETNLAIRLSYNSDATVAGMSFHGVEDDDEADS